LDIGCSLGQLTSGWVWVRVGLTSGGAISSGLGTGRINFGVNIWVKFRLVNYKWGEYKSGKITFGFT